MNRYRGTLIGAMLITLWAALPALSVDTRLLASLPPDHLAFIAIEPSARGPEHAAGDPTFMQFAGRLVQQISNLAGIDRARGAGIVADVITTLGVLADYPYLVVVTDARAKTTGPNRFKLAELQAGLLVSVPDGGDTIARQIQTLLTAHTQADRARIEQRVEDGHTVYTLVDSRSPVWARISWADVGGVYVVALGDAAFQSCLDAVQRSRTSDGKVPRWLGASFRDTVAGKASMLWGFHPRPVQAALGPDIRPAVDRVLTSLGLEEADHAIWSVRSKERAVLATVAYDVQGRIHVVEITREAVSPREKRAIPAQAASYAVIQFPVAEAIERAVQAYLTSRRPERQQALRSAWETAAHEARLDLGSELYAQLGDRIIIHDHPPHPLGIPLLVTILAEIRGSAASVERALDTVFAQADRWLAGDGERDFLSPRIIRQADGIWTLRVGFDGPSLGMSEGWIVVGHSPTAVRGILHDLGRPVSPAAPPTAPEKKQIDIPEGEQAPGSTP